MHDIESLKYKSTITHPDLGIKKEEIGHIVQNLSTVLASSYILYMKTQGFHWNVVGPHFYSLHKLSEELYKELAEAIDTLAERIRALGHIAPASYSDYKKYSRIDDENNTKDIKEQLEALLSDHESISRLLKEGVDRAEKAKDYATADLLVQRIDCHDKAAWMLRATMAG